MKVKVSKEKVIIEESSPVNENEINVNSCQFTLPQCFEGLQVTAIFNNIPIPVSGNTCTIPNLKSGTATLGVYAYKVSSDEIELMYSPEPTSFFVGKGSFTEAVNEQELPELSQFEQYCQALQKQFNDAADVIVGAIEQASALVGGA